jgi:L-rhamnose mutarotase
MREGNANEVSSQSEDLSVGQSPLGGQRARVAFKMKLFPGKEAEYKKRHDEIWPELEALLKKAGVSAYSIFLDEETNSLFGVLNVTDSKNLDTLPQQEVMQRWWAYMADIMEANSDNSPVSIPLKEVFYLP